LEYLANALDVDIRPHPVLVIWIAHGLGNASIGQHAVEGPGAHPEDFGYLRAAIYAAAFPFSSHCGYIQANSELGIE
jgi:hypothetical protein